MTYNVENLLTKLVDPSFVDYISKFDFACMTETFVDDLFDYSSIFMDHVKFFAPAKKLDRLGRNSGGVLVLVRRSFSHLVKQIKVTLDNTIILRCDKQLFNADKDVLFVGGYVAPESSPFYSTHALKDGIVMLEEALMEIVGDNELYYCICGDLNARTGREQNRLENMNMFELSSDTEEEAFESLERNSKDTFINSFGQSLLNLCFMFDCTILNGFCTEDPNGEFTYVSPHGCSVIDYFILSQGLCTSMFKLNVHDRVDSWHLPVELYLPLVNSGIGNSSEDEVIFKEEKIFWSDKLACQYKAELSSVNFKRGLQTAVEELKIDLDVSVDSVVSALYSAAACMVRTVSSKKRVIVGWFDQECSRKKKQVRRLLRKFKRTNDMNDRIEYVKERKEYKQTIKNKKKEYDESRLQTLNDSIGNPKEFWRIIRSVNRKSFIYNRISNEQWYQHFSKLFADSDVDESNNECVVEDDLRSSEDEEELFDQDITREEVIASIRKLKSSKSAGPDNIVGEMLKCVTDDVIDYLTLLFNKLFCESRFPREWSKSIVVPIFKKGDPEVPDNYRGVALTSVISKVYTHILNKRMTQWANREEKIIEQQAGFRAGYSTTDHIFTLYSIVQKFLQKHSKLYVAFVDFRKAFDSINRNKLWGVLRKVGMHGKLYLAIKSVYNSVLACVREKCLYTDYFQCPNGLKQGCLLSPMLFSFFINELAQELSENGKHGIQLVPGAMELFSLLFADMILLSSTPIGLQNQLDKLKEIADNMNLVVNLDKTNIIVFRLGGYLAAREKWVYGSEMIKVTNAYKYLGMVFTTKLSIKISLADYCRKGKKGVIEILKTMRRLHCADPSLFWKLFDTQVVPLLTYSAEVWGLDENIDDIEKVHTFAMKRFCGVPLHSSNKLMYGETGRYPLTLKTAIKCVKYWIKLIRLPLNRLNRQAYDMLCVQNNNGKINWVSRVQKLLTENGFGIVWLCQEVGSIDIFVAEFKDRLILSFQQTWHWDISQNERYNWYFSFKQIFVSEYYFTCVREKYFRNAFIRFRLRVCGLKAHKMWFSTEVSQDTSCPSCSAVYEDEIHFLFKCPMYNDLRDKYLNLTGNSFCWRNVSRVISNKNENKLNSLCKFITFALERRKIKIAELQP